MRRKTVVVARATNDAGGRVARMLIRQGLEVCAFTRRTTSPESRQRIAPHEVTLVESNYDAQSLKAACKSASCIVSPLSGLEDVMLGQQGALVGAAVATRVVRFIPSEFSLYYTKTFPDKNRNMNLRRQFRARLETAPIRATSVMNRALSTVLTKDAPILLPKIRRILHWSNTDQTLNFTTKDDVAEFTGDVALVDEAPRDLRIAGGIVSPLQLAAIVTQMSGKRYRQLRAGRFQLLRLAIRVARMLAPSASVILQRGRAWSISAIS